MAGLQLVFTVMTRPEDQAAVPGLRRRRPRRRGAAALAARSGPAAAAARGRSACPTVLSGRPLSGRPPALVRRRRQRRRWPARDRPPPRVRAPARRDRHRPARHVRRAGPAGRLPVRPSRPRAAGTTRAWCRSGTSPRPVGTTRRWRLLERRPDVDAIFAASDLAAFGVVRALRDDRPPVGDDVAVIGFDDIPAAADQQPPLTTVRQPIAELGHAMTRLLLRPDRGTQTTCRAARCCRSSWSCARRREPRGRASSGRRNWSLTAVTTATSSCAASRL